MVSFKSVIMGDGQVSCSNLHLLVPDEVHLEGALSCRQTGADWSMWIALNLGEISCQQQY